MASEYFVTWEIDVTADSAQDAARKALQIQRDPGSSATVFDVLEHDSNADSERIDPSDPDNVNALRAVHPQDDQ